ncbi:MAG: efflux RND transporter periplasmic adaptor subunit [Verrucomicrobiae bacterium]|nr:efflux RND transporter periplasmic adaptor subunit [Verrucomicrobiae bacterium]MCB1086876.1 efflux RND transporter periplasmic adaptor subunit [Verrucomicrobiae bacterium]
MSLERSLSLGSWSFAITIGLAAGAVSCGKHSHESPALEVLSPVTVETQAVKAGEVPVFEEVVGTVRPRQEAQVAAKVTGRVLEMKAVPGMRVKAGEPLAQLEVKELEAALDRSRAALAQADRELTRYRTLRESGAATQAEFEQAESQQKIAAATVQETQTMVANAKVEAPFDGTITRKFLEPGDLASPGRPLFSMEDSSLLRLEINVAEALAGTIKIGDNFQVEVSGAAAAVKGMVSEVSPSADVGSRTFNIKLDLPSSETLRAGQFGRAFLPRGERTAISVPKSAVISRGQMDYVFVAADGVARLRIVRAGESTNGSTEIQAGLDDGETIVLNPPKELRDGQPLAGGGK